MKNKWLIMLGIIFSLYARICGSSPANEYATFLPDLGDTDRSRLSPMDADFLGRQIIQDLRDHGVMLDDYDTLSYLNEIGGELVSYSPLAGQEFNFYLIKDKEINAFALPGGYVCFYNGLLYMTKSEAELVSVMSHEIGHVVQHHIFRNIGNYNRSQWLALSGVIAAGLLAVINPAAAILVASGGQGIAMQNMLSFSRDFEREADRVGQKIMYNAGFSPSAMPSFFSRMQNQNKFNNNESLAFLQTHPVTIERLGEAEERANQLSVVNKADSLSFTLVHEKAIVRQMGASAAIVAYQKIINGLLKNKNVNAAIKLNKLSIMYYGLSFAQTLELKYTNALGTVSKISDAQVKQHPAFLSLYAQILVELKKYSVADKIYLQALESYPNYKGLWLGLVDLYIKSKNPKKAASYLENLSQTHFNDADIWNRMALVYADTNLNDKSRYHYALGNQLVLQLNYKAALVQYQLALGDIRDQLNKAKTNNMLNDIISSRIIDVENIMRNQAQYGRH